MEHCLILKKILFLKDCGFLKHRKTHALKKTKTICMYITPHGTCHRLTISLSIISLQNTTPAALLTSQPMRAVYAISYPKPCSIRLAHRS